MSATQSIDDKINGIKPRDYEPVERKTVDQQETESEVHEEDRESEESPKEREIKPEKSSEEKSAKEVIEKPESIKSETVAATDDDEDEYGNKVEKSKTYTQEEVERMMRERLARVRHDAVQPVSQPQTQPTQPAPEGEDAWQQELASFVDNRLSAIEQRKATEQFQRQEQAKQAEFQAKFSMGMEKYKDFHATVEKMPITDAMMMATRDMKDPAAFIYAAAKLHPAEVQRIASIQDKFTQAAEVGRLEEKMRKARNISKTAKPLSQTKGDINPSYISKQSIEDKIAKHAKAKRR